MAPVIIKNRSITFETARSLYVFRESNNTQPTRKISRASSVQDMMVSPAQHNYSVSSLNGSPQYTCSFEHEMKKPKDVHTTTIPFYTTLEELYNGVQKKITYVVKRRDKVTGHKLTSIKSTVINIGHKGEEDDHNIVKVEGDELENGQFKTIVFVMEELPHRTFKRKGNNLYMNIHLSTQEVELGFKRHIKSLDGRSLWIHCNKPTILHGGKQRILNEGMVNPATGARGDLFISYKSESLNAE
ncbi:unnamed protein product [Rhizopus stolonifer]